MPRDVQYVYLAPGGDHQIRKDLLKIINSMLTCATRRSSNTSLKIEVCTIFSYNVLVQIQVYVGNSVFLFSLAEARANFGKYYLG